MSVLKWFDDLMDKIAFRTCTMNISEDRATVLRVRGNNWVSQAWRRYRGDVDLMSAKFQKYMNNSKFNAIEQGYLWEIFHRYVSKKETLKDE